MIRDHQTVLAAATELLRGATRQPGLVLRPDMALADVPDLDSLRLLETIALLEIRFAVEIDTTRLETLATVEDILQAILLAEP